MKTAEDAAGRWEELRGAKEVKNQTIYKRALKLAIPMMIQNGITNMVGLIDNVMVGSIGTEAMTAVSIVGQLIFVFNLAIFGGISGPGIYAAQYYGQGNEEGFRNAVRMKMWICGICIIAGLLLFLLAGENLIGLYLHGESQVVNASLTMSYAKEYLAIMLFTFVPFGVTQIYASSLRETGESIKPNLQEQLEQTQQEFDRLLEMSLDFDEDTPFLDDRLKKLNNKIKSLKKAIEDSAARQEKLSQPEMLLSAKDLQIQEYDDALTARLIEKITVRSRKEIEIRFIGGYEKAMPLE